MFPIEWTNLEIRNHWSRRWANRLGNIAFGGMVIFLVCIVMSIFWPIFANGIIIFLPSFILMVVAAMFEKQYKIVTIRRRKEGMINFGKLTRR